ncbi:hypothetical protein [Sphingomonas melonis]|uniref:Uncharacterized protein n=1 Tax=Sphingomonas melonis TaxID=152682 RepID=A0A7Y9K2U5_9SPHN|nr:hypothetical protein [Sphingomonas melonis]NYD91386.1 hypothetical protein [Sphingomonas melonis]
MSTFTEDDQKTLDDLIYRKAIADWSAREDARKAKLALVGKLVDAFTTAKVAPIVDAAASCRQLLVASDPTVADMLGNIETVMGFSGAQVAAFATHLATPEAEPTRADAAPAPADTNTPA